MIDTICVESPSISEELAKELEKYMLRKQAIYNEKIIYSFDTIPYENSYSNKLIINVKRDKWVYDRITKKAEKVKCDPYIRIEGSIHKFFLGHNCYGGSDNIYQLFYRMLKKIEQDLQLENRLPEWHKWKVVRIDYAKIYRAGSQENVLSYFHSLRNVYYPRGKVSYYAGEGIYRGGRTTSIKIYNKYEEFRKHDYKIWKKYNPEKADEILNNTKDIIRIEVEVKNKKIKYDYNKELTVKEIKISYLEKVYKEEIRRLLNEGEEMKNLKNNSDVRMYIYNKCDRREFNTLYAFYNDICLNGVEVVKKTTSKSTFYRNKKKLDELGINYINHDIISINSYKLNPIVDESDDTDLIAI